MMSQTDKLRIGILLPVADLYHRLWSDIDHALQRLAGRVAERFGAAGLDVLCSSAVSAPEQATAACMDFDNSRVDLILVALAPYCPSGVLSPALVQSRLPVLVWPMQSLLRLEPQEYDGEAIKLNHGVHAVQDLANVLGKTTKPFGVFHGHYEQPDFLDRLKPWVQAGRIVR
jgi:L-arabinose isomerase